MDVEVKVEIIEDEFVGEFLQSTSRQVSQRRKRSPEVETPGRKRTRKQTFNVIKTEEAGDESETGERQGGKGNRLRNKTPEEMEEKKVKDREKKKLRKRRRKERMTEEERQLHREKYRLIMAQRRAREKEKIDRGEMIDPRRKEELEGAPPKPKRRYWTSQYPDLPEEVVKERKEKYKFATFVKRLQMTEEEKQARNAKHRFWSYAKTANMTEEEKEIRRAKWRDRAKLKTKTMTPEERLRHRVWWNKGHKNLLKKWKEREPEKWAKHLERMRIYMKKRFDKETPEQRAKRLLRYKINQRKKKLKDQLEAEGVNPEEIERRVQVLIAEMKGQQSSSGPQDTNQYKPRPRKNAKLQNPISKSSSSSQEPSTSGWEPANHNQSSMLSSNDPLSEDFDNNDDGPPSPCSPDMPSLSQEEFESFEEPMESTNHFEVELETQPPPPMARRRGRPPKVVASIPKRKPATATSLSSTGKQVEEPIPGTSFATASTDTSSVFGPVSGPEVPRSGPLPEDFIGSEMCEECGQTFKTKLSLRIHKTEVHSSNPASLVCPKCSAQCKTNQELWNHFIQCQTQSSSEVTNAKKKRKRNQAAPPPPKTKPEVPVVNDPGEGEDNEPNVCHECGKTFRQKATLYDHIRRVHEGKGHQCDVCGTECQSLTKLWRHKVGKHRMKDLPPPFQFVNCKFCGEMVMRSYESHVRKKHPEHLEQFVNSEDNIKIVGVRTHTRPYTYTHVRRTQGKVDREKPPAEEVEVKCPHCEEIHLENMLRKHIRAKHSYPCPDCGKICETVPELEAHYTKIHALEDVDKKLEERNLIKFTHSTTKAALCLICNTNLHYSDEIRGHFVSTHSDVLQDLILSSRPEVVCELCGVTFIIELELQKHMNTAHTEECYLCPHCGLFRRTKSELDKHVRSHEGFCRLNRKRFGNCFICKKDFLSLNEVIDTYKMKKEMRLKIQAELRAHVMEQHPERFSPCHQCPKWMYGPEALKTHLSTCDRLNGRNAAECDIARAEKRQGNKNYMGKVLGLMKILCKVCKLPLTMKNMKVHLKGIHNIEEHPYQCHYCPRTFNQLEYCVGHMELTHEIPLHELVAIPGPEDYKRRKLADKVRRARKTKRKAHSEESEDDEGGENDIKLEMEDASDEDTKTYESTQRNATPTTGRRSQRLRKSTQKKIDPVPAKPTKSSRRQKKVGKGPSKQKEATNKYADIEREKRLVIYLYPLTEEDMKPYIKRIDMSDI